MKKSRIEIEKLDKGFKFCVYEEKENKSSEGVMYPEMERFEAASNSPEELTQWFHKWLSGEKFVGKSVEAEAAKPKGSMLTQGDKGYSA